MEILSNILVALGLLMTAISLRVLAQSNRDNHDWNRRKAALDLTVQYNELTKHRAELEALFSFGKTASAIPINLIDEAIERDSSVRAKIHNYLNYFEYLALGVREGVLDEAIIRNTWSILMTEVYRQFGDYIEQCRKSRTPNAWEYIDDVITDWKKQQSAIRQRPIL